MKRNYNFYVNIRFDQEVKKINLNKIAVPDNGNVCKYSTEYFDGIARKVFKCDMPAVRDGLCMFHHPDYWKGNINKVLNGLEDKIRSDLEKDAIFLIGYRIPPNFNLKNISGRFNKPIFFTEAIFLGPIDFSSIVFTYADFSKAKFHQSARFIATTFKQDVDFRQATFKEKTYFNGTIFKEKVYFRGSVFYEKAYFVNAIFRQDAFFIKTDFQQKVDFAKAIFKEGIDFRWASFKKVNFKDAIFVKQAIFRNIVIYEDINFENAIFLQWLYPLDLSQFVDFRRVKFKGDSSETTFDRINPWRMSFLHTNVTRVQFRNINWFDGKSNIKRYKIYDCLLIHLIKDKKFRRKYYRDALRQSEQYRNEKYLEKEIIRVHGNGIISVLKKVIGRDKPIFEIIKEKINGDLEENKKYEIWCRKLFSSLEYEEYLGDLSLDNVLGVYRQLRENHDYYLKYEESGNFFIGEMDALMLKDALDTPCKTDQSSFNLSKSIDKLMETRTQGIKDFLRIKSEKAILRTYKYLALYGESYLRPLIWAIVLVLLFAIVRTVLFFNILFFNILDFSTFLSNTNIFFAKLLDELHYSFLVFFQIISISDIQRGDVTLERVLAIPVFGSFYVALRRKFERKIRH